MTMFVPTRRNFLKGTAVGGVAAFASAAALPARAQGSASGSLRHPAKFDVGEGLLPVPTLSAERGTDAFWEEVRESFGLADRYIHMNTGTTGSMPLFAQQNLAVLNHYKSSDPLDWARQLTEDYPEAFRGGDSGDAVIIRQAEIAEMFNADPGEIILTYNTTDGCAVVFAGIPWREGDRIIVTSMEHAGMMGSAHWAQTFHGVDIVTVPLPSRTLSSLTVEEVVALFETELDAPLPAGAKQYVAFSEIPYKSGTRLPVKEICTLAREKGAFSIVDSAHGWGMLPVDCHDSAADFIAGAGHKWLCGGPGTGILYVRNSGENLPEFGFNHRYQARFHGNRDWEPAAVMQGRGEYNRPALIAMGDVARYFTEIGTQAIYEKGVELGDYLKDRIAERWGEDALWVQKNPDPSFATALTSFNPFTTKDDSAEYDTMRTAFTSVLEGLNETPDGKIYIRTSDWRDAAGDPSETANDRIGLRISTHGVYNSRDHVDILFDHLVRLIDETGLQQV